MNRAVSDRRLLKLAEFLKTVPPKQFDYGQWVGDDWKGKPDLSCGTKACAMGWASTMPEFRRLGLRLQDGEIVNYSNGTYGFRTAAELFGLSDSDSKYLFSPDRNRHGAIIDWNGPERKATPKQVARKIEKFVYERAKREGRKVKR